MRSYEPLIVLPVEIQRDFNAQLHRCYDTDAGSFRLVDIKTTEGKGSLGQRITVMIVDESGFPIPNVRVAFSFDTANQYFLTSDYKWVPPYPHQAFIAFTDGGGQCDMVLGAEGVVLAGRPGGVTVYPLTPDYASDAVSGLGMLADHSGLMLTFQLRRTGVQSLPEMIDALETRMNRIEQAIEEWAIANQG